LKIGSLLKPENVVSYKITFSACVCFMNAATNKAVDFLFYKL